MLVICFLHSIVDGHRSAGTVAVLAAAPIGDILVVVAADFVVSVAVEYERSPSSLGWNKGNSLVYGHGD